MTIAESTKEDATMSTPTADRFLLWIDGVGVYSLFLNSRVTIGGPNRDHRGADLLLLAPLSRQHATIVRSGESYLLEAHGECRIAGRRVDCQINLLSDDRIELLPGVRLRFRVPTVMSMTAVVDFESSHRPSRSMDGVILMHDTCLLGRGPENHIRCPGWEQSILLYRQENRFCCKSVGSVCIDGKWVERGGPIEPGSYVRNHEAGFRIEAVAEELS